MTRLLPQPRRALRIGIYGALAAFGLIGSANWPSKLIWLAGMAFLLGSFREARIEDGQFERRMVLCFAPRSWKRWPLERFAQIQTRYGDPSALSAALPLVIFHPLLIVWGWLFDWMIPWLGGAYQLRLRSVTGGWVLVWQGNSESNFRENVALLERATGLPVRRA